MKFSVIFLIVFSLCALVWSRATHNRKGSYYYQPRFARYQSRSIPSSRKYTHLNYARVPYRSRYVSGRHAALVDESGFVGQDQIAEYPPDYTSSIPNGESHVPVDVYSEQYPGQQFSGVGENQPEELPINSPENNEVYNDVSPTLDPKDVGGAINPTLVPSKKDSRGVYHGDHEDDDNIYIGSNRPSFARMSPGTFFPIGFGETSGGSFALSNSFSTGRGGSASSQATAYGSDTQRFRSNE